VCSASACFHKRAATFPFSRRRRAGIAPSGTFQLSILPPRWFFRSGIHFVSWPARRFTTGLWQIAPAGWGVSPERGHNIHSSAAPRRRPPKAEAERKPCRKRLRKLALDGRLRDFSASSPARCGRTEVERFLRRATFWMWRNSDGRPKPEIEAAERAASRWS